MDAPSIITCPLCGYISPMENVDRASYQCCNCVPVACEHLWALKSPITRNIATQDYQCIQCKEIKRGMRS